MDEFEPDDAVVIGGPVSRLSVSVRIAGDTLDPAEITRRFGVTPKFAASKGDQVKRGHRTVTQRSGIWTYRLTGEGSADRELDDAIVALLARLPDDSTMWRELAQRFTIDVFCGLFMGSENQVADLRPSTLALLAERGLALGLDIYGPPPFEAAT